MAEKQWKRNERMIADFVGGKRVPVTGRARGDAPDIAHETVSIEVKLRARIPFWIKEGMDQAEKARENADQLPVLIIREKGQHAKDALVCMSLKEFRDRYL